jgi:hypothetical protein
LLVAGYLLLVAGCWLLVAGCWLLVTCLQRFPSFISFCADDLDLNAFMFEGIESFFTPSPLGEGWEGGN